MHVSTYCPFLNIILMISLSDKSRLQQLEALRLILQGGTLWVNNDNVITVMSLYLYLFLSILLLSIHIEHCPLQLIQPLFYF